MPYRLLDGLAALFPALRSSVYSLGFRDGVLFSLALVAVAYWIYRMKNNGLLYVMVAAGALFFLRHSENHPDVRPSPLKPDPSPRRPLLPILPRTPGGTAGKPVVGGLVSPDGAVRITCDLPASQKRKNVGGRDGAGLCVFTSIEYGARFQNERRLQKLQDDMRKELGGGWPDKVDKMLAKYGQGASYVQHTKGDTSFLKLVLKTGRMPGVTYGGYDPHYRGYVAHMVTMVHLDDEWAAISDNNYPGDEQIVWMSVPEFEKRWKLGGGGWAVVLLNPPASPTVKN